MSKIPVNGILLIYHHWLIQNAPTIMEHVNAFERYSRFKVWKVNTELGFPEELRNLEFQVILLHYSLFAWSPFYLDDQFLEYIEQSQSSYKIAFFQDELRYWPQRSELLDRCSVECVYTLVEPTYFKDTYKKKTRVPKLVYTLPGYVSDELVHRARRLTKPDQDRAIDIGYRGRRLPFWMGKGSQEKHIIALRFRERAADLDLKVDVETEGGKRIYGEKWYEFLSNCRAVLGVEAGVSIFDIDNVVYPQYERLMAENPRLSFEEIHERLLYVYEDNIFYRTISPRHFETAALRVTQILFEGKYSGIMEPMVHYIPLKKDFSNFDDVIRMFRDEALRRELTENAYRDLIASGQYSYQRFIESFDQELLQAGLRPGISVADAQKITELLEKDRMRKLFRANINSLRYRRFPGRNIVRIFVRPLLRRYGIIKQHEL
jgi:hypothetical protein